VDSEFLNAVIRIGELEGTRVDKAVMMISAAKLVEGTGPVSIKEVCDWFEAAHLARPNPTLLLRALTDDRRVSVRQRKIRALAKADDYLKESIPELMEKAPDPPGRLSADVKVSLSKTPAIDGHYVAELENMLELYATLHALENSMRRLIERVLTKEIGANWWDKAASSPQKKKHQDRLDKERERKWLPARSSLGPLYSLDWTDLISIIRKFESLFLPFIGEIGFMHRFADLGLVRHVVAHHGFVDDPKDYERVKLAHHDWEKQVGSISLP
jgi:hypothetical protein